MVHRLSVAGPVFVDDSEGRGTDGVFVYAEPPAYCSGESGFAGSHGSIKGYDTVVSYRFQKLPCSPVKVSQVLYCDRVSHVISASAMSRDSADSCPTRSEGEVGFLRL